MQHSFSIPVSIRSTINSVRDAFNDAFPFLKIEFFRKPHVTGSGSIRKFMYTADENLRLISEKKKDGKIIVRKDMTVNELEQSFEKEFGLYVQVFRKSGNVWLETSATDNWTLEQQNEEGRSLQNPLQETRENPDDHDIW